MACIGTVGFDGASVNLGKESGISTLLKNDSDGFDYEVFDDMHDSDEFDNEIAEKEVVKKLDQFQGDYE